MASKTEKAILKALGKKFKPQGPKEDRQAFLKRAAKFVSDLDDGVYKALPDVVKDWYEGCVAATKKKAAMPEFGAAPAKPEKAGKGKRAAAKDEDEEEDDDSEEEDEEDDDEDDDDDSEEDEEESEDEDEDEDEEDDADSDDDGDEDEDDDDGEEDADDDSEDDDDDDEDDAEDDADEDDDGDGDEDEDEEEEEEEAELTLADLEVGDQVTITLEDKSKTTGKVVKALPKAVTLKTKDGLPVKIKQSEVASIIKKGAKPAAKDEDEEAEEGAKAPRNTGSGPDLRALIIANYDVRDWKKIAKLAEKKAIAFKVGTLRLMHNDAHKWVDGYLAMKKKAKG